MPVQWTVENHCIFKVIVNTSLLSKIAIFRDSLYCSYKGKYKNDYWRNQKQNR